MVFKIEEVDKGKIPPVQGLDLLKLQIEQPLRWLDSYEMYGERTWAGKYGDPSDYGNYGVFKAKCKICGQFSEQSKLSWEAQNAHFMHCAREHGYIFPEEASKEQFKVRNAKLQAVIVLSMQYDLPLPGYADHESCIKQYQQDKVICVIHKDNEYEEKNWLGRY